MTRRFADFAKPLPRPGSFLDLALIGIAAGVVLAAFAAILALLYLAYPARATWKPQYAQAPQEVQDWYARAELTPEAQQRFHFKSCCAKADVVRTKFKVDRTTGADVWQWLDGETWRVVPPDIIHGEQRAPGGEPIMFVVGGNPVCFFIPESGN